MQSCEDSSRFVTSRAAGDRPMPAGGRAGGDRRSAYDRRIESALHTGGGRRLLALLVFASALITISYATAGQASSSAPGSVAGAAGFASSFASPAIASTALRGRI